MINLSGKTALVTGASRGIGRASALALGKAGAQVLVHYGRAASEADAVVNQIRSDGGRAHAIAADLSMADGPKKLAFDVGRMVEGSARCAGRKRRNFEARADRGNDNPGFPQPTPGASSLLTPYSRFQFPAVKPPRFSTPAARAPLPGRGSARASSIPT
jgi:hypothetical protein